MAYKKEVKLEDIAKQLNISIVSVSNALNGKKGVSQSLREKVIEKAKELGYEVLDPSSAKIEKKKYYVGVVIAERYIKEFPSFYMDIYKVVAQDTTKRGSFTILEIVSEEKEKNCVNLSFFSEVDIDGLIIIGEMNVEYVKNITLNSEIPTVYVDYYGTESNVDYVVTDSYGGVQKLTQLLIDKGHREIAFLGTREATNSIMDRYQGYCKALLKNRLPERVEWILGDRKKDRYSYRIEFDLPENMPTAFVCNCDKTAYALIDKLESMGYHIPNDISVVGFDYHGYQNHETHQLVTYENDVRAVAQISVNMLMKRLESKRQGGEIRIVEGRIVFGNTIKDLGTNKGKEGRK